jgi:hypothetical protein
VAVVALVVVVVTVVGVAVVVTLRANWLLLIQRHPPPQPLNWVSSCDATSPHLRDHHSVAMAQKASFSKTSPEIRTAVSQDISKVANNNP